MNTSQQAAGRRKFDKDRQDVADAIAEALRALPCCQPADGWKPSTVKVSVTTSDCPLLTLTHSDGQAFNITITRARP